MPLLNSGQIIGHYGEARWTPYAEAIASHYVNHVPFYLNVPTGLTGAADEETVVVSRPWKYDVLIFGAYVKGCIEGDDEADMVITEDSDQVITEDGDDVITEAGGGSIGGCDGQQIFLQVADRRSLLPWVTASPINAAPMSAFGGSDGRAMPLLKLPEAFFLPAGVELQHNFSVFGNLATGGSIDWVGVQLINPIGQQSPKEVEMPDGSTIPVGSRIPWFAVIGIGRETTLSGDLRFRFAAGARVLGYTQPVDCDVEIHDISCNFFLSYDNDGGNIDDIQFTLSDTGNRRVWSQNTTPAPALMGDTTKAYPALPWPKPYILKKGDQLELTMTNQGDNADIILTNGYLIIRGVKLCGL